MLDGVKHDDMVSKCLFQVHFTSLYAYHLAQWVVFSPLVIRLKNSCNYCFLGSMTFLLQYHNLSALKIKEERYVWLQQIRFDSSSILHFSSTSRGLIYKYIKQDICAISRPERRISHQQEKEKRASKCVHASR